MPASESVCKVDIYCREPYLETGLSELSLLKTKPGLGRWNRFSRSPGRIYLADVVLLLVKYGFQFVLNFLHRYHIPDADGSPCRFRVADQIFAAYEQVGCSRHDVVDGGVDYLHLIISFSPLL